jgi:hypothetical protein
MAFVQPMRTAREGVMPGTPSLFLLLLKEEKDSSPFL